MMNELIDKLLELQDTINSNVTTVDMDTSDERPGTDTDTLEMVRDEITKFIEWFYDYCGDREELMK